MARLYDRVSQCFIIGNVVVPLSVGTAIYVVARPDSYISKFLCAVTNVRIPNRLLFVIDDSVCLTMIRNHLADYLWAYAFTVSVMLIGSKSVFSEFQLMMLCFCIAVILEVSQIVNPYFTFDFIDILAEIVGIVAGWLVYHWHNHIKERGRLRYESKF